MGTLPFSLPPQAEMQRAFFASDASYTGVFFTGVRTTGIFCLPTCPARKPKPENVEFFPTVKAAMFAGYRPCKRCKPEARTAPAWVRQLLEQVESAGPGREARITEGALRAMHLDPARVRRHFQREYGMTFQAYCRARRLSQAFESLRAGKSVDDAVFDSGFESHSGFRAAFAKLFGTPPGKIERAECVQLDWIETPLGPMVAGAVEQGICLLEFTDRRMLEAQLQCLGRYFGAPASSAPAAGPHPHLTQLRRQLQEYFAGTRRGFTVPLVYPGTSFEKMVWEELLRIPHGETFSYEQLAQRIGRPKAARAVGHANGMNRIGILIPCHRVVTTSGELGGYGGGLWRKRFLLDLERGANRP